MASGIISMFDKNMDFEGTLHWQSYTTASSNTSTIVFTFKIHKRAYPMVTCPFYANLMVWERNGAMLDRVSAETPSFSVGTDDVTVYTHTSTIPHNADGTKTVEVSCGIYRADTTDTQGVSTWYVKNYNSDGTPYIVERDTDSYTLPLDTIIRIANVASAPDITDKTESATIKYTNPMGTNVSSLQVCIANETGNKILVPYREVSATGSSYTFNLSSTERQALVDNVTNGSSTTIRFYIKTTIYGLTHYHFLTKTYTLTSAMPTIAPTIADMNETTIALTGDYNRLIRYCSDAAVSINAVAKQGATITKCNVECGSYRNENTNGIFRIVGPETGVFKVSATDSRGNKVSETIQKTMVLYEKVSCNLDVDMELVGSTGAKAVIHIRGNYFSGSFGAASNTISLQYRYAIDSGSPGNWTTIDVPASALSDHKYNIMHTVTGLNYKSQYKFQCRVSDKLTDAISDIRTVTLQPIFDWSGSDFNFNVPVNFQGGVLNDFIVEQGTDAMGTNGTWYWFKYKSGRSECYGYRNFGNMGVSTAFGALYRSAALTQQLPQGVFMSNVVPDYISINVLANGTGWICRDGNATSPSYSTTGSFYVVSPTSGNQSAVWLGFHVIGRWK